MNENKKPVKGSFKAQPKPRYPQTKEVEADQDNRFDSTEATKFIQENLSKVGLSENHLNLASMVGKEVIKNSKFVDYFSLEGFKPYFAIDHAYVIKKLKEILFPFTLKKETITEESTNALPNISPDLYLPLMAFITYILLIGFNSSYQKGDMYHTSLLTLLYSFKPEILGTLASKNFFIILLECLALKLVLFIFSNLQLPFCDSIAYVGYKFVLLVLSVLIWTVLPNRALLFGIIALISIWSMLFIYKNLKARFPIDNNLQRMAIYIAASLEVGTILLILFDLYYFC